MTVAKLVQEEALRFGRFVSDDVIDHILWSHTGFPHFWTGDPETCCRAQVEEFFQEELDGITVEWPSSKER